VEHTHVAIAVEAQRGSCRCRIAEAEMLGAIRGTPVFICLIGSLMSCASSPPPCQFCESSDTLTEEGTRR
jgi:hypothetical protein